MGCFLPLCLECAMATDLLGRLAQVLQPFSANPGQILTFLASSLGNPRGSITERGVSVAVQGFPFCNILLRFVLFWYCELLLWEFKESFLLLRKGSQTIVDRFFNVLYCDALPGRTVPVGGSRV